MNLESRFLSLDLEKIEHYISSSQEENLHLEFKTLSDNPLGTSDDKKNYSSALSGFANSSGGLLIWGIVARKNDRGVDCAVDLKPIKAVDLLISRLNELEGDAVSPHIDGVQHKPIPLRDNEGFAVTYIPESISGPHMAKLGEYRYYKRSGDSFYKMEHFDIEDMFGRRKKPDLSLSTRIRPSHTRQTPHYTEHDLIIYISVVNNGRGSAIAPFLSVRVNNPYHIYSYGVDGNRHFGLPELNRSRGSQYVPYGSSSDFYIHPGISIDVTAIKASIINVEPNLSQVKDLTIKYVLAADGVSTKEGEEIVSRDELISMIGST